MGAGVDDKCRVARASRAAHARPRTGWSCTAPRHHPPPLPRRPHPLSRCRGHAAPSHRGCACCWAAACKHRGISERRGDPPAARSQLRVAGVAPVRSHLGTRGARCAAGAEGRGRPAAACSRSCLPAQYSVHWWSGSSASTASWICGNQCGRAMSMVGSQATVAQSRAPKRAAAAATARCRTLCWLNPKYSGPAMAVFGGGGRSSPALRRASISELMRLRI